MLVLIALLVLGCTSQPTLVITTADWSTSTPVVGQSTFGNVELHVAGTTSADTLTVETRGDGLIGEQELTLVNGDFDQREVIAFTHQAVPATFSCSTTVRAYGKGQVTAKELVSPSLTY